VAVINAKKARKSKASHFFNTESGYYYFNGASDKGM
jgi:hypothetical protein